ncbi:hypothetical protein [Dysgonomonas sp. BGC7]|uniref:hypothetical protein n=1 Tax=Dysgonomonas sp. BGC7 TaxID=1658008 RepID=UPI0006810EF5|nr:hypothetical protein [Dysgonomonas sp. BGC7]MBD8390267.1 hypothetical protein [Dysgonomonas sp. BGC7]
MKKIFFLSIISLALFSSCQNKSKDSNNKIAEQIESLDVQLNDTVLGNNFEHIDFDNISHLTKAQYDSLQLQKVSGLEGYDISYLSMGDVLLQNTNGRILTIQVITDGEITEYLLSYDNQGNLIDNMIVAYEDMVEYYSHVSTSINSNKVTVQTINYTYSDPQGNPVELSDTAIVKYQITPEFKFITD